MCIYICVYVCVCVRRTVTYYHPRAELRSAKAWSRAVTRLYLRSRVQSRRRAHALVSSRAHCCRCDRSCSCAFCASPCRLNVMGTKVSVWNISKHAHEKPNTTTALHADTQQDHLHINKIHKQHTQSQVHLLSLCSKFDSVI